MRHALLVLLFSCADPVHQAQIDALGPEADGVPQGELHRPGQPCLVCHSEFAVAGTIWASADARQGAAGVTVLITDVNNNRRRAITNAAGNFTITTNDWPDLTFPLITGLQHDAATTTMSSTINREGSCNFCHGLPTVDPRTSIGPIVAP